MDTTSENNKLRRNHCKWDGGWPVFAYTTFKPNSLFPRCSPVNQREVGDTHKFNQHEAMRVPDCLLRRPTVVIRIIGDPFPGMVLPSHQRTNAAGAFLCTWG